MNEIIFVKPLVGLIVRDPVTMAPVPEDGLLIDLAERNGKYWIRQITQGSLIVVKKEEQQKDTKTSFKRGGDK